VASSSTQRPQKGGGEGDGGGGGGEIVQYGGDIVQYGGGEGDGGDGGGEGDGGGGETEVGVYEGEDERCALLCIIQMTRVAMPARQANQKITFTMRISPLFDGRCEPHVVIRARPPTMPRHSPHSDCSMGLPNLHTASVVCQ